MLQLEAHSKHELKELRLSRRAAIMSPNTASHPQRYEDHFSIRFGRRRTRDWMIRILHSIAAKSSFTVCRTREVFPGFDEEFLKTVARGIWTPEFCKGLRLSRPPTLTNAMVRRLARRIDLAQYLLRRRSDRSEVVALIAKGNIYPAIGYELWLKPQLRLFGGFVCIRAESPSRLKELSFEVRNRLQGVIPERLNEPNREQVK
jgi:hypothetical protein